MKFVDEARIEVRGGDGGAGCVSFLREKYRPKGGPDGGNGGDGGRVVLVVDMGLATLVDFKFQPKVHGANGQRGRGKDQHGRRGRDREVRVPPGTVVRDMDTGELIADLRTAGDRGVVAEGGRGGRGNASYASSRNRAPRFAQPGTAGEERRLLLELRVVADAGLVGFPNVGKSTLIRRISAARPRVAEYPFTTLVPHLGVVRVGEQGSFVVADIPGLIEGAHSGQGLGQRFLRHVTRAALLVHLLDVGGFTGRDPLDDFDAINRELTLFDADVAAKPQIVVANKVDLLASADQRRSLQRRFERRGVSWHPISAATGSGVAELVNAIGARLAALRERDAAPTATAGG